MKGFVLLLVLLKVLGPIRAITFLDEFDITKALNETIVRIFQSVEPQNTAKLMGNVLNDEVDNSKTTYEFNYTWFDGKTSLASFRNIKITYLSFGTDTTHISYGILNNKMHLRAHNTQLVVELHAAFNVGRHSGWFSGCNFMMRFTGPTISALKQSSISGHSFLIDLQFNDIEIMNIKGLHWSDLRENFEQMLPSILRTRMNRNEKLSHAFGEIYDNLALKHIISKHPHFLGHEKLCHYLIPQVPFASFNLKNVIVKGLTNFHSLNFTTKSEPLTYILIIKDIRGSMILEDVSRIATTTLELLYHAESLSIFVTQDINRIRVQMETYTVIETRFGTGLTNIQSDIIMDQIEWAIGSSIMPSMEYQRTNRSSISLSTLELETNIRQILNTMPRNPIQSREDTTTNIIYNYHISFPNMVINLLSGNPQYPDRKQCASPTNPNFSYRINVAPTGEINSNNNKTNGINVNFNFNYPSVNISLIKPNNPEGNDSCEFQIRNNRDIKVELSPPTYNSSGSKGQLKMKKKIDATLLSMTKDRIVRIVKPIISVPFDVCSQTVKIVDDFFLGFIDIVLKKCSFRRDKSSLRMREVYSHKFTC